MQVENEAEHTSGMPALPWLHLPPEASIRTFSKDYIPLAGLQPLQVPLGLTTHAQKSPGQGAAHQKGPGQGAVHQKGSNAAALRQAHQEGGAAVLTAVAPSAEPGQRVKKLRKPKKIFAICGVTGQP